MWIRSQDETELLDCNSFWVVSPTKMSIDRIWTLCARTENLVRTIGDFPTKEAVMAELDCIEIWIGSGGKAVYPVSKQKWPIHTRRRPA